MAVANTLSYDDMAPITAVKSFILQTQGFGTLNIPFNRKLKCLSLLDTFFLVLYLQAQLEPTQVELFVGRLITLPSIIRHL
jgi:hypothetical protein